MTLQRENIKTIYKISKPQLENMPIATKVFNCCNQLKELETKYFMITNYTSVVVKRFNTSSMSMKATKYTDKASQLK